MPFMKVIRRPRGVKAAVGTIVLVEDDEIRDGVSVDTDGNEYPTDCLALLTEEEQAACLKVEEIPI